MTKYGLQPPDLPPVKDLIPEDPLLLMGAGPVPIATSVANANGVVINHIGQTMDTVISGLKQLAQYVYQTESDKIIGVAGPSSGGMEMAIASLVWPGRKVLVLEIGTFSARWAEMSERVGGDVTIIENQDIRPVGADQVRQAFDSAKYDVVIVTHGETSSGVFTTELAEIGAIARESGALTIVDAVTTLGTMPFQMDDWHLDAVVSGGQKGLGSIPGISLVAFSAEAWQQIDNRTSEPAQWCYDAKLAWQFWGKQQYHYTAPVPGVLALYQSLYLIKNETLHKRYLRHQLCSKALQKGIQAMGLELFVPEEYRLDSVISINMPAGVDSAELRNYMAKTFSVEISGAFGHNIVRIGQMGEQCRSQNLFKTLYALGMSCQHFGVKVDVSKAMAVMEENLALDPETIID
jgi:alanine-glyoxylate transaminase/serine-glyoxylate transaminase/serine-pyruvate transaminase